MTEKYNNPQNLQTALDCAVRDSQGKKGGYKIKDVSYCNYMTNNDWNIYHNENIANYEHHIKQFIDGSGGELKEGKFPPKMASFGSSSRFIFELSKHIDGFNFEQKLDTRVGGIAHLDGCIKRENKYIFVEAKKREIYGNSKGSIKNVYIPVYEHIKNRIKDFSFVVEVNDSKNIDCSKITFNLQKETVEYFDLKQLICHFLGITYDIAKHSINNTKVKFVYLIYNPHGEIEEYINNKYTKKLLSRYDEVEKFIKYNIENKIFENIFNSVLSYQIDKNHLNEINIDLEMNLADQYNYKEILK